MVKTFEIITTDVEVAKNQGAAFLVQCVKNLLQGEVGEMS